MSAKQDQNITFFFPVFENVGKCPTFFLVLTKFIFKIMLSVKNVAFR